MREDFLSARRTREMFTVARRGEWGAVLDALREGADAKARSEYDKNVLMELASNVCIPSSVAMALCSSGVPASAKDAYGFTAMMRFACGGGLTVSLARTLASLGCPPEARDWTHGRTAGMLAAGAVSGRIDVASFAAWSHTVEWPLVEEALLVFPASHRSVAAFALLASGKEFSDDEILLLERHAATNRAAAARVCLGNERIVADVDAGAFVALLAVGKRTRIPLSVEEAKNLMFLCATAIRTSSNRNEATRNVERTLRRFHMPEPSDDEFSSYLSACADFAAAAVASNAETDFGGFSAEPSL